MKVLVGLSGGVDSSSVAKILKDKGYEVIGATMTIWGDKDIPLHSGSRDACFSPFEKNDVEAARKIASQLDIPYYVFDCSVDYHKIILENFKKEYLTGRTPNPCVWCNSIIKFGLLPHLARESGVEFDKFATGHYARIEEKENKFYLMRGKDYKKDQSYFLYRLKPSQLAQIMLPLGDFTKEDTRKFADRENLLSAHKKDSQDFYDGDYNELLDVEPKIGNIVDTNGNILGTHKGIWNYTIGQRRGLLISANEPIYVLELRKETNEVVVGHVDKTFKKSLTAKNLNWIAKDLIPQDNKIQAKIRSNSAPQDAKIEIIGEDEIKVIFDDMQKSPAKGQSVVIYKGDYVIGGGVIENYF